MLHLMKKRPTLRSIWKRLLGPRNLRQDEMLVKEHRFYNVLCARTIIRKDEKKIELLAPGALLYVLALTAIGLPILLIVFSIITYVNRPTADEYAIYAELIQSSVHDWKWEAKIDTFLVGAQPDAFHLFTSEDFAQTYRQAMGSEPPQPLWKDLRRKHDWVSNFRQSEFHVPSARVIVLSNKNWDEYMKSNDVMVRFLPRNKKHSFPFRFSRVGFNENKTEALVLYSDVWGHIVRLKKTDGKWEIVQKGVLFMV